MAAINIVITGAALTPNPVTVSRQYIIQVEIKPVIFVLGDDTCRLCDADGALIQTDDIDA